MLLYSLEPQDLFLDIKVSILEGLFGRILFCANLELVD
jgi:hypothetical protein